MDGLKLKGGSRISRRWVHYYEEVDLEYKFDGFNL